jgi:hypothetical protein
VATLGETQTKLTLAELNIVCLGKWNKRIFTPPWVSANLFGNSEQQIAGVVNPVEVEITYSRGALSLTAKDNALEIKVATQPTDKDFVAKLESASKLLNRALELLPQTPITGVGFNVRYIVPSNFESNFFASIKKSFVPLNDSFLPTSTRFTKQIQPDKFLNCIVEPMGPSEYMLTFNLHYNKLGDDLFKPIFAEMYQETNALLNE